MARYHGKSGAIYISTSAGGAASLANSMSEWTLDMTTDMVDVTAFGDPNKAYVQGLKDIKGTIAAWFDDTNDVLFDAADSPDGVRLGLYPSTLAPTIFHEGPAWINASISVSVTGAVSVKGNFTANGAWARHP
jgi:hypothetical protein